MICHACLRWVHGRHVVVTLADSFRRKPDREIVLHVECAEKHGMMPDDPPIWGSWPLGFSAPWWLKRLLRVPEWTEAGR